MQLRYGATRHDLSTSEIPSTMGKTNNNAIATNDTESVVVDDIANVAITEAESVSLASLAKRAPKSLTGSDARARLVTIKRSRWEPFYNFSFILEAASAGDGNRMYVANVEGRQTYFVFGSREGLSLVHITNKSQEFAGHELAEAVKALPDGAVLTLLISMGDITPIVTSVGREYPRRDTLGGGLWTWTLQGVGS